MEEKISSAFSEIDIQKAMLGYETAIQLWATESQNRMSHYNAMLVANSLILAAIGFLYQTTIFNQPIRFVLTTLGILLCIVWYMSEKRMIEKAIFWHYAAREIEWKYFADVFLTIERSVLFSKGQAIEFQLKREKKHRRMKFWGRRLKSQTALIIIIVLFVVMYVSVLVLEIVH